MLGGVSGPHKRVLRRAGLGAREAPRAAYARIVKKDSRGRGVA